MNETAELFGSLVLGEIEGGPEVSREIWYHPPGISREMRNSLGSLSIAHDHVQSEVLRCDLAFAMAAILRVR